jgi:hypothetical protein
MKFNDVEDVRQKLEQADYICSQAIALRLLLR